MRKLGPVAAVLAAIALFAGTAQAKNGWLKQDHTIFFPESARRNVSAYQSFPVFWWGFLVVRGAGPEALETLCSALKGRAELQRVECDPSLSELAEYVKDWSEDLPLRSPRPSDAALRAGLKQAL